MHNEQLRQLSINLFFAGTKYELLSWYVSVKLFELTFGFPYWYRDET
jgi:hypothetical protein